MTMHDDVTRIIERARSQSPETPTAPDPARVDTAELRLWGVPRIHRRALPGREHEAGARAVDAWDADRPLLVLSGVPGTGKSFAAARWLWSKYPVDAERWGESLRWWDAREVQMLGRYDLASHRALVALPVLVLDDLGAEPEDESTWWDSRIELLLSRRMEECRGTVVTTNLSADALRMRYGARLYDRLRHQASWVEVSGANLRREHDDRPRM